LAREKRRIMKLGISIAPAIAVATAASALLVITGFGIYGALTATVSNSDDPLEVSAGTLILELENNGKGFTEDVTNLAPGDTVNRYVVLTNSGSLDGDTLTVKVTPTGDASLIDDGTGSAATKAVTLAISSCSVAWVPGTGACGGTTTVLRSAIPLGDFEADISLGSGTFEPTATKNLQISLSLPDQDETTVNGVLPTDTVQGKSVSVTYTFGIVQRTATTTNQ
jgi:hypothetical protein